jgi:hypothetical protein
MIVNSNFLFDCCSQKGYIDSWFIWIEKVITKGTLSVKSMTMLAPILLAAKLLDRVILLPLSFSTRHLSLSKMVSLAQQNGPITGLVSNLVDKGVDVLQ